jgi:hypothetical protein
MLAACVLLPQEFPMFISVHKLRWFTRTCQLTAVEVLYVAFFWALALDTIPSSMAVINFRVLRDNVVLKVRSSGLRNFLSGLSMIDLQPTAHN